MLLVESSPDMVVRVPEFGRPLRPPPSRRQRGCPVRRCEVRRLYFWWAGNGFRSRAHAFDSICLFPDGAFEVGAHTLRSALHWPDQDNVIPQVTWARHCVFSKVHQISQGVAFSAINCLCPSWAPTDLVERPKIRKTVEIKRAFVPGCCARGPWPGSSKRPGPVRPSDAAFVHGARDLMKR